MYDLFRNESKRLKNVYVLLFCSLGFLLFLSFVLQLNKNAISPYIMISSFICLSISILVIPSISFDYLHDINKASHIISLPYSKAEIFFTKYLAGLCCLLIPNTIYVFLGHVLFQRFEVCFIMIVVSSLFGLLYYTLHCLIANVTGTLKMQLFLFIFVIAMPILLYTAIQLLLTSFVKGWVAINIWNSITYIIFPASYLIYAAMIQSVDIIYSLYSVLLFCVLLRLCAFFCVNSRYEYIGQNISFKKFDKLVRFFIVVAFSWLITSFIISGFESEFYDNLYRNGSIVLVIITFVVSFISEIIEKRNICYQRALGQTMIISLLSFMIFFFSINTLEGYIPNKVEKAGFSYQWGENKHEMIYSDQKDVIDTIKQIHENCIEDANYAYGDVLRICYQTKQGKKIERQYNIDGLSLYHLICERIKESKRPDILIDMFYDRYQFMIKQDIKEISFWINDEEENEQIEIKNDNDIKLLMEILKERIDEIKKQPDLLKDEFDYSEFSYYKVKNDQEYQFFYYENDPFDQAIHEYINIKQNS